MFNAFASYGRGVWSAVSALFVLSIERQFRGMDSLTYFMLLYRRRRQNPCRSTSTLTSSGNCAQLAFYDAHLSCAWYWQSVVDSGDSSNWIFPVNGRGKYFHLKHQGRRGCLENLKSLSRPRAFKLRKGVWLLFYYMCITYILKY